MGRVERRPPAFGGGTGPPEGGVAAAGGEQLRMGGLSQTRSELAEIPGSGQFTGIINYLKSETERPPQACEKGRVCRFGAIDKR